MDPMQKLYEVLPGGDIVHPPPFPKRPDLFNRAPLAPALTEDNAFLARRFWQQPDESLGRAWKAHVNRPYKRAADEEESAMHALAHNVYEHLMSNPLLPISRDHARAKFTEEGLDETYNGVQGLDGMEQKVFIHGLNVRDPDLWTKDALTEELTSRGLSTDGRKTELQRRLWEYECDERFGVSRQSNLSHWGIHREPRPVMSPATRTDMSALEMYTAAIKLSPYNPTYWNSRAYCHYLLGHFDLAIGDAYRGELLCEVLTTATQRNKRPGMYTRVWDAIQQHLMTELKIKGVPMTREVLQMRKANGVNYFIPTLRNALHSITSLSLAALNCWDDFDDHMQGQLQRPLPYRDVSVPKKRMTASARVKEEILRRRDNPSALHPSLYGHEWSRGWISGADKYPYDQADVRRESPYFINALNANLFMVNSNDDKFPQRICQVQPLTKDNSFNGLGVFATANIKAGTLIHCEEPVIRGNLIPNRLLDDESEIPLHASRCDNCQTVVDPKEIEHISNHLDALHDPARGPGWGHPADCACVDMMCKCTDVGYFKAARGGLLFCSSNDAISEGMAPHCLAIARETYHFQEFCGLDWGWLHDSMRTNKVTWSGSQYFTHTNERHGTILSLLLKSVFELTLHRRQEDPNLLAHEINELIVLEAGSDTNEPWKDSWFPFTLAGNIQIPFDILFYLGVDIFCDLSFDTWVIQTVLRKLLVNAVPWEHARRGANPTFNNRDGPKPVLHPTLQSRMRDRKEDLSAMEPSFGNFFLFPGLSMFNHSCRPFENALWGYDDKVLNRVVVWANKDIKAGEEIRIPYQRYRIADPVGEDPELNMHAVQLFGKNCECPRCQGRVIAPPVDKGKARSMPGSDTQDDGTVDWTPGPVTIPPKQEYWRGVLGENNSELDYLREYREIVDDIYEKYYDLDPDSQGEEEKKEGDEAADVKAGDPEDISGSKE
ncbi:Tetratricopeptide-like helical [Penicillium cf. griseofulvum]|uniref:Histone-lysine N-methyltransferase SET5 n=1 Tax=Penicillium cf. griseofulvum TaxID=2972120 RepID=A0A9W9JNU6_9EURO|nr:Tetratricopeptide-like helical [Penicillium cf. griseofulvum]KAJ5442575.1 Tetratricopeptide-like helical [Penicillium cf. griseofulvum]